MKRKNFFLSFAVLSLFLLTATGSDDSSSSSSSNHEKVYNSSWDGSVRQVERYLKKSLKDPDSYQSIEWSKVVKQSDGSFMVRHKYRAKNSFGGYVVEEKIFSLDSEGNVIGCY